MMYLGLDYGQKRVGVACSDEMGMFAEPINTIHYQTEGKLHEVIAQLVKERPVGAVVVGMPIRTTGEHGVEAEKVKRFVERLRGLLTCEVTTWDERFTSQEADRLLKQVNLSRDQRKSKRDQVAAKIMLQSYLDFKRMQG